MASQPCSSDARDQPARGICSRRCAFGQCQARGLSRGRRSNSHSSRPPRPGRAVRELDRQAQRPSFVCCWQFLTFEGREISMAAECPHLSEIKITSTTKRVCEDCVKTGDDWVHLRLCLECGHVGCCDSSKNKHATRHFHSTKHPLIRSLERGETWVWCYVDETEPGDIVGRKFVPLQA